MPASSRWPMQCWLMALYNTLLWVIKRNLRQAHFLMFICLSSIINAQSIDLADLKINGKIGYFVTLDELESFNIPIDSVTEVPELMDMSMADSLLYIGGTYFELYSNSNKCLLNVIIFDERVTKVEIGDINLNRQTTIESLQTYFQEDCRMTNKTTIHQDPTSYSTCSIPIISNGRLTDSRLIFFLADGQLKRIDIWEL